MEHNRAHSQLLGNPSQPLGTKSVELLPRSTLRPIKLNYSECSKKIYFIIIDVLVDDDDGTKILLMIATVGRGIELYPLLPVVNESFPFLD